MIEIILRYHFGSSESILDGFIFLCLFQIWNKTSTNAQGDFETNLDCCGWATKPTGNETCPAACGTAGINGTTNYVNCYTCKETVEDKIDYAFNSSGGVGLFFAFTEVIFFSK